MSGGNGTVATTANIRPRLNQNTPLGYILWVLRQPAVDRFDRAIGAAAITDDHLRRRLTLASSGSEQSLNLLALIKNRDDDGNWNLVHYGNFTA